MSAAFIAGLLAELILRASISSLLLSKLAGLSLWGLISFGSLASLLANWFKGVQCHFDFLQVSKSHFKGFNVIRIYKYVGRISFKGLEIFWTSCEKMARLTKVLIIIGTFSRRGLISFGFAARS